MLDGGDEQERMTLLYRGTLDLCVLAVLADEPQHAYGVVQRLADNGFGDVSYGTVYPLVTRLRRTGLVQQAAAPGRGGPARNVLSLTADGVAALERWAGQWRVHQERVASLVESMMEGQGRAHVS